MPRFPALLSMLALTPLAPTQPAHAVTPHAIVWISTWNLDTTTICAEGWIDDGASVAGEWTYTITGANSNLSTTAPAPVVRDGAAFPRVCQMVATSGFALINASLTFAGVTTPDPAGDADTAGISYMLAFVSPVTSEPFTIAYDP